MPDPVSPTSFSTRPWSVQFDLGFPTGAGIRAGYSPIPQLQLDLNVGSILLLNSYGADVTYRPLAGAFNISPMVRAGVRAVQNNLAESIGGPPWQPMGLAEVGFDWRTKGGFSMSLGVGAALVAPGDGVAVIPAGNLSIGYAF